MSANRRSRSARTCALRELSRHSGDRSGNVVYEKGHLVGRLCPDCQTPEENAEAEINKATLDYGHAFVDDDGRWWTPPKNEEGR